jgi:ribose transport system substrate-binding protein
VPDARVKAFLSIGAFAVSAFALAWVAPGKDSVALPAPAAPSLHILSLQTLNNPIFRQIEGGVREGIEASGGRLVVLDAGFSTEKQRADLAAALEQCPAALFINPVNWEGLQSVLVDARRRKVPVVIVDTPVRDRDLILCEVSSDNLEAGRLACRALAAKNPSAHVGILHLSLNRACIDRVEGFREEMLKHPGMEIVAVREGRGRAEPARPVAADLLRRFPEIDALFAVNDPSALGAIGAIRDAGRRGAVDVVSVDGSEAAREAIAAGDLLASVAQSPAEIGRIAARHALAHLAGRKVPPQILLPVELLAMPATPQSPTTKPDP